MRRGIFALLAVMGIITPCCGAMVYYAGSTAAFNGVPAVSSVEVNPFSRSAGAAAISLDMADLARVRWHAPEGRAPAWVLDLLAVTGPKNGERFAYGLALVAAQVQGPPPVVGEASELTTLLMIGAGLMGVGLARRYVKPA
jgi:hypothetical protein